MQETLPLFPLNAVVFPRTPLPLHIFEDRYREMISEAIRDGTEFGVVLAREKGIVNIGCAVAIEKVMKDYEDGRMDILTTGRRRFRVDTLDEERAFLRGGVEYFDDESTEATPVETKVRVLEHYKILWDLQETQTVPEPALDDPQLSFQLAHIVQDLEFRQVMLQMRSEAGRMRQLAAFLEQYVPRQQMIAGVRKLAPMNGHSRIPTKFSDIQ